MILFFFSVLCNPLPADVGPAEDAASQYVQRYGCGKVKEWANAPVQKALQAWADNVVTGVKSKNVYGILNRGVADGMLEHMGELTTMIQALDEAATGDLWKAAEIAGGGAWEMELAIIGGPYAVAVWTVMKELNTFATQLNEEIVYINLKTAANFAEQDSSLRSADRVNYFLNSYLKWKDTNPVAFNSRERQFRTMFYEYVKVVLNQSGFPDVNDWQANENRVRAAAASMLQDINLIVEARERQKALGEKAAMLRAEVDTIREFQGWWTMIKGLTCNEDSISGSEDFLSTCMSAAENSGMLLAEAEQRFNSLSTSVDFGALKNEVNQHENAIDRAAGKLEGDLAAVEDLCRADQEEWDAGERILENVKLKLFVLESFVESIRKDMQNACRATEISSAETFASQAEDKAGKAGDTAREVIDSRVSFTSWEPPVEITFQDLLTALENDTMRLMNMRGESSDANQKRGEILSKLAEAREQLTACDHPFLEENQNENIDLFALLNNYRDRISELDGAMQSLPFPTEEEINTVRDQLISNESFVRELMDKQKQGRMCLDDLPDMWEMADLMDEMDSRAKDLKTEAETLSARARSCADAMSGEAPEEDSSDEGFEEDPNEDEWPGFDEDENDDSSTGPEVGEGGNEPETGDGGGGWVAEGNVETVDGTDAGNQPAVSQGGFSPGNSSASPSEYDPQVAGWIRSAESAFSACNFESALRYADWIAARDPDNPWLNANYRTIIDNANRQRQAMSALQQAQDRLQGSSLEVSDLQAVRQSIQQAAQFAPNCMVDKINGVLGQVSNEMVNVRARDRQETAVALGGLISTLTTAATMVQAAQNSTRGGGYVPTTTGGGGGGGGGMVGGGGSTGGATGGGSAGTSGTSTSSGQEYYCSITIAARPSHEDELIYWALVDFYFTGSHPGSAYLVVPVTKRRSLDEALAIYGQKGAPSKVVATGSREAMKAAVQQKCPNPATYAEY
ncbi:MAG TPA: hypothetical protein PK014_13455 [Thermoanaerobaculia bacterium]|nr:hypothetical protein [Thermoanaerobaculia bacterium]HUM31086.1 hypothetical protein [Thermoanaerobaculia bacterium]HXK69402.1 hypothetical protein [Thermoanaerobaculia bacterium]